MQKMIKRSTLRVHQDTSTDWDSFKKEQVLGRSIRDPAQWRISVIGSFPFQSGEENYTVNRPH